MSNDYRLEDVDVAAIHDAVTILTDSRDIMGVLVAYCPAAIGEEFQCLYVAWEDYKPVEVYGCYRPRGSGCAWRVVIDDKPPRCLKEEA